jgi:hypothetical protein
VQGNFDLIFLLFYEENYIKSSSSDFVPSFDEHQK